MKDYTSHGAYKIFALLSNGKDWTVKELQQALKPVVTEQAIYKQLRAMENRQIVVRHESRFGLSLAWLIKAQEELASSIELRLIESTVGSLLPKKHRSFAWRFGNLLSYDRLIVQLLLAALESSPDRSLYQWMPVPWFILVSDELTRSYARTMKSRRNRAFVVVASDTKSSRRFGQLVDSGVFKIAVHPQPRGLRLNTYISSAPPFIVTGSIDRKTMNELEAISRMSSLSESTSALYQKALRIKTEAWIKIENNPKKAESFARLIRDTF